MEKGLTINMTEKGLTIVNPFSVMFRYEDFWIITLIILLIVYILGKSKHLIGVKFSSSSELLIWDQKVQTMASNYFTLKSAVHLIEYKFISFLVQQ